MKTRLLIVIIVVGFVGIATLLLLPDEQQNTCEQMGGKWKDNYCTMTQETFDSNKLTCDPGTVLEDGTCKSNGIKLIFNSFMEPESRPVPEFSKDVSKAESIERFCAYIGFKKYPENLFTEFLENPYNKDVTFLNITDADLKHIPEFHELILQANQMEYPLNKRTNFVMTSEEILELRSYLEQRPYFEFNHAGQTFSDKLGSKDSDGNYRYPEILIDEKLYRINGISFNPIISGQNHTLNVSLEGNLQEIKDSFIERNNPKNPNITYIEINKDDKTHLAVALDAIDKIQKSKDKIRMSKDVGSEIQDKVQDFFAEQNKIQFNGDNTKYTKYFMLNDILYETSFVIC